MMTLAAFVACLAIAQPLWSAASGNTLDCAPAAWPAQGQLDASQLIQGAQREAAAGDPAAQWLLGALYIKSEIAQDRGAGIKWLQIAAHTAAPAVRRAASPQAQALSETELYATMREMAEALPRLVEREGPTKGVGLFYDQARTILQVLIGCADRPSR